jgi:hypothetical protein
LRRDAAGYDIHAHRRSHTVHIAPGKQIEGLCFIGLLKS